MVNEVGIKAGTYSVKNGSGLHDVNRMSPRQLVRLLAYMHTRPALRPEYLSSLAVAAGSGTLSNRMDGSEAEGILRAKTGTLSVASALSGYVPTKVGETLAFSLLINNFQADIDDVWAMQDELGATLASISTTCESSPGFAYAPPLLKQASSIQEAP